MSLVSPRSRFVSFRRPMCCFDHFICHLFSTKIIKGIGGTAIASRNHSDRSRSKALLARSLLSFFNHSYSMREGYYIFLHQAVFFSNLQILRLYYCTIKDLCMYVLFGNISGLETHIYLVEWIYYIT